ncbi:MAG TPA: hypothetical protein VHX61_19605 [Rhizomicrobium sp.]|jgi:hypothetical protein|nr:hypothetical protein [Rhizomicrobium sp.]
MPFPFELAYEELVAQLDACVDAVFGALRSEFLDMPKGQGFIEYPVFEQGYEALKRTTGGFRNLSPDPVFETVNQTPIALIVLRAMLGLTPPEWGYLATQRTNMEVSQGAIRALDRRIRMAPRGPPSIGASAG